VGGETTVTGHTADHCARYLRKGRWVFVDGRLETTRWQDSDGTELVAAEVRATRVVFLHAPGAGRAPGRVPNSDPHRLLGADQEQPG